MACWDLFGVAAFMPELVKHDYVGKDCLSQFGDVNT